MNATRHFAAALLIIASPATLPAQTPGTLDPSFNPDVTGVIFETYVRAIAVQPDGKIIIGGQFTHVGGQPRNNIARLLPDGTVESLDSFRIGSGSNAGVQCIAVQHDGKIIIGGSFSTINGQQHRAIVRLLPDGTPETSATFNIGNGSNPQYVDCLALQPDGKILVAGGFTGTNGQSQASVARLHPDGTLESTATFDAPGGGGGILCMALQPDGKILIGGSFTSLDGQPRTRIARLDSNGAVTAFSPGTGPDSEVEALCLQPDGRILISGSISGGIVRLLPDGTVEDASLFTTQTGNFGLGYVLTMQMQADGKILAAIYRSPEHRLMRIQTDGTVEGFPAFDNVVTGNVIRTLCVQADGRIIIAGDVEHVNGSVRRGIARIYNGPAPQTVTVTGRQRVEWTRGGSAPEVEQVTFELSSDGGASWAPLGPGVRMAGGWERTGLTLPASGSIRARGRTSSGGTSSSLVETVAPFSRNVPEISIQHPAGVELVSGAGAVDFGSVVVDSDVSRSFAIRNTWTGELSGVSLALAPDGTPADFTITPPSVAILAPGASIAFAVTVNPSAIGPRSALLRVASNDEDENPFEIALTATGRVPTPLEAWRTLHFGSPYSTGSGADLNDPDGDGIANLMEFATINDPLALTLPIGLLVKNGSTLEFTYRRPRAALADVRYDLEASATISGTWGSASQAETILSDDGIIQQVKATYPAGITGKRFVRLRVTQL